MLKHARLDEVSGDFDFSELQAAAAKVGKSDPNDALELVDCDPADIRLQVADMSEHLGALDELYDMMTGTLASVAAAWTTDGAPDEGFLGSANDARARYAAIYAGLAQTKAAGNEVADEFDEMAKGLAGKANSIVEETSAATALVLYGVTPDGEEPDDDTKAAARRTVEDACTDLDTLVRNATDGIPGFGGAVKLRNLASEYDAD